MVWEKDGIVEDNNTVAGARMPSPIKKAKVFNRLSMLNVVFSCSIG